MRPTRCPAGSSGGGGARRWRARRHFGADPRARFFKRFAFAAMTVVVLALVGIVTLTWNVATSAGAGAWAAPISLIVAFATAAIAVRFAGSMRRTASPLRAVMEAADRVADGDYGVRVQEHGPPPLRALAHSFNTMTARLQQADRLRRDLMADVAHELRTPLSVLQGRLEGLVDGVYPRDDEQIEQLLEETRVLSRLVDDLRTVALSDAGVLTLHLESSDIAALVQDAVRSLQADATRQSVALTWRTSAKDATMDVDPLRIREVLTNLLTNALRHTAAGQAITVVVRDASDGIAIDVTDTGEGMPPEAVARIFDRFYKGPRSRGAGLGLAIAKAIVAAHGGGMTASSQVGTGTTVSLTLPRTRGD
ncbi:MAG: HAMP domain-containing histidine kinase [Acidobacteria bacterium]|nr:HAMP domain-containing histidine kinase [Acidobacteriota bacterium]